jgi:light-regulated signal transduction histidine kinase (bacteriophytochrome)
MERFKAFAEKLEKLDCSPEQKADLLSNFKALEKEYTRLDFLHRRTTSDKTITINILQKTVEELQKQKNYVENINTQLTEQQEQLEEQSHLLEKNLVALQMSYNELEQFAFIASHDLKSPLRNISSFAQLIKARYAPQFDREAEHYLDFIISGAKQMYHIISDLLTYSQLDQEKDMSFMGLEKPIEQALTNLKAQVEENQAHIEIKYLPKIWMQHTGMVQLFQNLIENAIKYRSDATPSIVISSEWENSEQSAWHIRICDNGLGLDEAYHEKAFMPFQRINYLDRPGSGIGLAICKKVVKLHGGDIWYTRNIEGGTTFHFTIPNERN